jgi:beta-fructofuranosidase
LFLSGNPRESVLLATSTDMKNWTKVKNFKITAPAGYYDYEFRDPHVFFNTEDGKYWMLVSAQTSDKKAVVLKFTTTNPASGNWRLKTRFTRQLLRKLHYAGMSRSFQNGQLLVSCFL